MSYHPGEPVVYRITKASVRPGPRAQLVAPSPQGDLYSYLVEKFWIVERILDDGRLLLKTRRGKERIISGDDPNLRPARWWERLLYRNRFPHLELGATTNGGPLPKHRATG